MIKKIKLLEYRTFKTYMVEQVRYRKFKALSRNFYVINVGYRVNFDMNGISWNCFVTNINIPYDWKLLSIDKKVKGAITVYAVFDNPSDFIKWKLKN